MDDKFIAKISKNYEYEVERILELNQKFMEENDKNIEIIEDSSFDCDNDHNSSKDIVRIVIPKLEPQPFYRYFVQTNNNVVGTDDPVLRFVPFIEEERQYTSIVNFEDSLLTEEPLTKLQSIKEKYLRDEVFHKFDDISLFNIYQLYNDKNYIGNKEQIAEISGKRGHVANILEILRKISEKLKMPIKKILEYWMQLLDENPKPLFIEKDSLNKYFCSVCFIFDCGKHEEMIVKRPIFEEKTEFTCKECSKSTFEMKNRNVKRKKLLKKTTCNNDDDENAISKILPFYEEIRKNYQATPCLITKYLNFLFPNTDSITCAFIRDLSIQHPITNRLIYKKPPTPASFPYKRKKSEFYSPCYHKGSCFNNSKCRCFTNQTYCEEFCWCESCDLVCKCSCENGKSCQERSKKKCKCVLESRECTKLCKCINSDYKNKRKAMNDKLVFSCKENQSISNNEEKETYVAPSSIEGFGLFTTFFIPKFSYVIEYTGELITNLEAERRGLFYEKTKLSYLFDLSKIGNFQHQTIDATKIGNKSRFINHSRNPNLDAKNILVNGEMRIAFFAKKDIKKDEELFFDYQYKDEQKEAYEIKD